MINMNDVKVEQAIAQERYQVIIAARQQARARAEGNQQREMVLDRALGWLGRRLVGWGSRLEKRHNTAGEQAA
jgi:hypothetical protein